MPSGDTPWSRILSNTHQSLGRIAAVVALATVLSKVAGLLRQQGIAAAFGVGAAYDAFSYAYVVPGFLLILLGGINGPLHSAMVAVLSRRQPSEACRLLENIRGLVGIALSALTLLLLLLAGPVIDLLAPGLVASGDVAVRQIAIQQLRLMAPMGLLSGLIGLGFGALNARDSFWLPAISPLLSSLTVLLGLGLLRGWLGPAIGTTEQAATGGLVLAAATLVGALLQWLVQLPALRSRGLAGLGWRYHWRDPGVREVMAVMAPATLSAGMLQINVLVDLFFASWIPGAAAGLGYAGLLVQAPLGILSNMILVPLLPLLSRLTARDQREAFLQRSRQGLMLSAAGMLPLGALLMLLARPLVEVVYARGAFDDDATTLVSRLLIAYGLGMAAYLGRDVAVRIFYALGDGRTPFRISIWGIALNALLDWLLTGAPVPSGPLLGGGFGAAGLVLATAGVNVIALLALLLALQRKLGTLPWRRWAADLGRLLLATAVASLLTAGLDSLEIWPGGLLGNLARLLVCGGVGLLGYGLVATALGVPEVTQLLARLSGRLGWQGR